MEKLNYDKNTPLDDRIKDLELKIQQNTDKLQRMKECREVYKNLPFGEGDAVFHKEFGNVIIRSVEFGAAETNFEDITYTIVTIKAQTRKVSYKDVVAITPATKVIYGKTSN